MPSKRKLSDGEENAMVFAVLMSIAYAGVQSLMLGALEGGFTPACAFLVFLAASAPLCGMVEFALRPCLARLFLSNATRALLCGCFVLAYLRASHEVDGRGDATCLQTASWLGIAWFFLVAFVMRMGPENEGHDPLRRELAYPAPCRSAVRSMARKATCRWYAVVIGDPRGVAPSRASLRKDLEGWEERLAGVASAIMRVRESEAYMVSTQLRETVEALLQDFMLLDGVVKRARSMTRGLIPDVAGAASLLVGPSITEVKQERGPSLIKADDVAPTMTLERKLHEMDARFKRAARDATSLNNDPGLLDRLARHLRLT